MTLCKHFFIVVFLFAVSNPSRAARTRRVTSDDATETIDPWSWHPERGWASIQRPLSYFKWDHTSFEDERHGNIILKRIRGEGDLTVPLAPEDGTKSPNLILRVRVRIAPRQPAQLGTLVVHCGGPGSDRTCLDNLAPHQLDRTLADRYNIVAIDQRGIGVSDPVLYCKNVTYSLPPVGEQMKSMENFTNCPCDLQQNSMYMFNQDRWESTLEGFKVKAERLRKCYASGLFNLAGYNVMDYIGTTYLAHDLNLLRKAIGADKLSIYGISYGTWVGAVYASQYPEYTDKVIIDSNLPPAPDVMSFSEDYASNQMKMIAEFARRCRAIGDKCIQGISPEDAYNEAIARLESGIFSVNTAFGKLTVTGGLLTDKLHMLMRDYTHMWKTTLLDAGRDLFTELSEHSVKEALPFLQFADMVNQVRNINSAEEASRLIEHYLNVTCVMENIPVSLITQCISMDGQSLALNINLTLGTFSCPTWKQYGFCASITSSQTVQNAMLYTGVMAADVPSRYLPSQMLMLTKKLHGAYGAIGYQAAHIMEDLAMWPARSTYPGIGSGKVTPLIVGVLTDSATGFKWTQEMKLAFPLASLMTWQGYHHGMPSPFSIRENAGVGLFDCYQAMRDYLSTGVLPRNGYHCHSTS